MVTSSIGSADPDSSPVMVGIGAPMYFIFPPRWPIIRTPRTRGGVRLAGLTHETHLVVAVTPEVERVFHIESRDGVGKPLKTSFTVEPFPRSGLDVGEISILAGWFIERVANPVSGLWGPLVRRSLRDLPDTDPIAIMVRDTIAAGPQRGDGSGGSGGGSAGGAAGG